MWSECNAVYLIIVSLALIQMNCNCASPLNNIAVEDSSSEFFNTRRIDEELKEPEKLQLFSEFIIGKPRNKSTVGDITRLALQSKLYNAVFIDLFAQHYDSAEELKQSGGPLANEELCLKHLEQLVERLERLKLDRYETRDGELLRLLDTFGRKSSGIYLSSGYWIGSYNECLRLSIGTADGQVPTRYCVASIHPTIGTLSENSLLDVLTVFKKGVCLPKSCGSMNYKNKLELISKLTDYNTPTYVKPLEGNLTSLYCLPDSQSPLRTWWLKPKTVSALVLISGWIFFLIYATIMSRKKRETEQKASTIAIYKALSITNNLKSLFSTKKQPNSLETGTKSQPLVNLSVIDGIKAIAMIYITIGHVLMCMTQIINDGTETSTTFLATLVNVIPGYVVNVFFGITGLLTSYLMFKRKQVSYLTRDPTRWVAVFINRYLRIMPAYIIMVVYAKYFSKYVGSGPLWDYGTSELAHRRPCEQESWLWTVFFGANFRPLMKSCVQTGWYLACDFQFLLLTPIFLILLQTRPDFGKLLLRLCIFAGFVGGFLDSFTYNHTIDFRPILQMLPHGFRIFLHMQFGYTFPLYRIPAYLCGLLAGYYLYEHERDKSRYLSKGDEQEVTIEEKSGQIPDWPNALKRFAPPLCILYILLAASSPFYMKLYPLDRFISKILLAFIQPTLHLTYSLNVCLFILLASTGNGYKCLNSFLSASFWKPFARLSLCALLCNVDVSEFITQSKTELMNMDFIAHLSLNLITVLAVYLAATLLHLLFEAPIKAIIDHIIFPQPKKEPQSKQRA